jgi:UDP-N-acetylmuramoyl-L-alanyl-D-glutamate--2,6-diaminopimelate ligase
LAALAARLGLPPPVPDAVVTGVASDSRAVRPGDLYAALPGTCHHGAQFAAAAAAAGAVAALTDHAGVPPVAAAGLPALVVADPRAVLGPLSAAVYDEPARRLLLLGVTGTNGKTTVCYLLDAGLRAAGHVTGLVGTVETRVGDLVAPSARTTPEAPDLQALFAVMREHAVTAAAMEVSSHALALRRVDGTAYAAAAFTNLSRDHLDFHRDLPDYFAAKARLFTPAFTRVGVVNVDDPWGRRLVASAPVPVTTYGTGGDWRVADVASGPAGSTFRVRGSGVDVAARVRLPGVFNVTNALAAVSTLVAAGVPVEAAVEGVGGLAGIPGRMERVDAGQPFLAVVDYAHTPEAVAALLAALRAVTDGRLVIVLGCGGDRDRDKRPLMGAAATRGADLAVLTSDNPRSEDPLAILAAMEAGAREAAGGRDGRYVVEPDRAGAIRLAVAGAGPGDTVVVAGKGHEQGQEIAGVVTPFDDRAAVREAIMSGALT